MSSGRSPKKERSALAGIGSEGGVRLTESNSEPTTPKTQKAELNFVSIWFVRQGHDVSTYIVGGCDCYAVLEWMPAHVKNLFVEIY